MISIYDVFLAYLHSCEYRKNLDFKTLKAYKTDIAQFLKSASDAPVCKETILEYIDALHSAYKPKTVKRKIASVKAFTNYLLDEGIIDHSPFERIRLKYKEPITLPKTVSTEVLELLLRTMYSELHNSTATEYQYRSVLIDVTVTELLFATGMRVSELCNLTDNDIDIQNGVVHIHGKGLKERIMQIENVSVLKILNEYVLNRRDCTEQPRYFFINRLGRRFSEQSVRSMLLRRCAEAGIRQHITPHMLRHTFATLMLEEDVDIRYIQNMLGHSSIKTTQIYTHIAETKQRQILANKHPRNKLRIE